jgi:hypothetical protein
MKKALQVLSVFVALAAFTSFASAKKGEQHEIFEEIMKKGFKSTEEKPALLKKVVDGSATAEEKTKLAQYIKKLVTLKPPEGNADSWKKKTQALVSAMEKNDLKALKNAANCKACHKVHK